MSCNKCDLHNNGFKSEDEFVIFQELIASLVKAGQLMELERKLDARFFDVRYQCNFCQTFWTLSYPDQSYRGGWNAE